MAIALKKIKELEPGELKIISFFYNKTMAGESSVVSYAYEFKNQRTTMPWSYTEEYCKAYDIDDIHIKIDCNR